MKILIIRHGEPDYAADSLTVKGWREARLLSERLARENPRDIFVSPLGRARDTARPTLEKLGRTAETLPWLSEFRALIPDPEGSGQRIPWNLPPRLCAAHPELYDREGWLRSPLYDGSNVREVWEETVRGVDGLLARYGYAREGALYRVRDGGCGDSVALFCHFAKGMAILAYLLGMAPAALWQGFSLPPSSVTTVVTEEREEGTAVFRCTGAGDISHLYAAGEPMSHAGLFRETLADPWQE